MGLFSQISVGLHLSEKSQLNLEEDDCFHWNHFDKRLKSRSICSVIMQARRQVDRPTTMCCAKEKSRSVLLFPRAGSERHCAFSRALGESQLSHNTLNSVGTTRDNNVCRFNLLLPFRLKLFRSAGKKLLFLKRAKKKSRNAQRDYAPWLGCSFGSCFMHDSDSWQTGLAVFFCRFFFPISLDVDVDIEHRSRYRYRRRAPEIRAASVWTSDPTPASSDSFDKVPPRKR